MSPKQDLILLRGVVSKCVKTAMGKRTRVQIKCPHIIQTFPFDLTTEDKELGTDHCRSMAITTDGPGTIDYDAGPLSRYWSQETLISKIQS